MSFVNRDTKPNKDTDRVVVQALGDSWYSLDLLNIPHDMLDFIHRKDGFWVGKYGTQPGLTLDEMAFGKLDNSDEFILDVELKHIKRLKPRFLLLSGGGNDMIKKHLSSVLREPSDKASLLDFNKLELVFKEYLLPSFQHIIHSVWAINKNIDILAHGYGYPSASGKPYAPFIGPWLKPQFDKKGISQKDADFVLRHLIDRFNLMLEYLDNNNERFHHIDLRKLIKSDDWMDEIHLTPKAFSRLGKHCRTVMTSLL